MAAPARTTKPPRQPAPARGARAPARRRPPIAIQGARLLRADRALCLKRARAVIRAANLGAMEVGVLFVHDIEMRALNRAWRHIDKPTDVLSFATGEGEQVLGSEDVLGDLVISVDTARRQARALGHPLADEVAVLVAHGICHLFGLDHENGAREAETQRACEATLLAQARVDVRLGLTGRV